VLCCAGVEYAGVEYASIHGVLFSIKFVTIAYVACCMLHVVCSGGNIALEEVGTAVAAHATCYEKTSKLYALKVMDDNTLQLMTIFVMIMMMMN